MLLAVFHHKSVLVSQVEALAEESSQSVVEVRSYSGEAVILVWVALLESNDKWWSASVNFKVLRTYHLFEHNVVGFQGSW